MSDTILPIFQRYEKEGAIVGRLLAGYGELEFDFASILAIVINDVDVAYRAMFRARGEEQRLLVADALIRPKFKAIELYTPYCEAYQDLHHCRKIRNQFAHCHWYDDKDEGLCFLNLENTASKPMSNRIRKNPVDLGLLKNQEVFFVYVQDCLEYLEEECKRRSGRLSTHSLSPPKRIDRPPKHNGE